MSGDVRRCLTSETALRALGGCGARATANGRTGCIESYTLVLHIGRRTANRTATGTLNTV
eukprot:1909885-Prymnesium_polylepis.1